MIDLKNEMEIYKFVNTHPKCMSMLYDLNLMPETTKPDNLNYIRMIAIIHLFDQIENLENEIKNIYIHGLPNIYIHGLPNAPSELVAELMEEVKKNGSN